MFHGRHGVMFFCHFLCLVLSVRDLYTCFFFCLVFVVLEVIEDDIEIEGFEGSNLE